MQLSATTTCGVGRWVVARTCPPQPSNSSALPSRVEARTRRLITDDCCVNRCASPLALQGFLCVFALDDRVSFTEVADFHDQVRGVIGRPSGSETRLWAALRCSYAGDRLFGRLGTLYFPRVGLTMIPCLCRVVRFCVCTSKGNL